jgi:hypothetical protein
MGVGIGCRVMELTSFYAEAKLEGFDRRYFIEEGYHGVFVPRGGSY